MAWGVSTAAWASPSVTSPIFINTAGTPGRLYLLWASREAAADPYISVSDNGSNGWSLVAFAPASGGVGRRIELWYCIPTAPFTQVQLDFTGTSLAQATLVSVTGFEPLGVFDQVNSGFRSATTTPTAFTVTPTVSDTLVMAGIQANPNTNAQTSIADTNWLRLTSHATRGPHLAYRTDIGSGVTAGVSWTLTNSAGSGHIIVSLVSSPSTGSSNVSVWDGSNELPAVIEGVWDGANVVPAVLDM